MCPNGGRADSDTLRENNVELNSDTQWKAKFISVNSILGLLFFASSNSAKEVTIDHYTFAQIQISCWLLFKTSHIIIMTILGVLQYASE